jgi:hypothetical protein
VEPSTTMGRARESGLERGALFPLL